MKMLAKKQGKRKQVTVSLWEQPMKQIISYYQPIIGKHYIPSQNALKEVYNNLQQGCPSNF